MAAEASKRGQAATVPNKRTSQTIAPSRGRQGSLVSPEQGYPSDSASEEKPTLWRVVHTFPVSYQMDTPLSQQPEAWKCRLRVLYPQGWRPALPPTPWCP